MTGKYGPKENKMVILKSDPKRNVIFLAWGAGKFSLY